MISKFSRHRRKSSLSRRRGRGSGRRGIMAWNINWRPILLFGGIGLGVVALVLVAIFVIVPLFGGGPDASETASNSATATPIPTPIANENLAGSAQELIIDYKSINDPYVYGNEIIFSTGDKYESAPEIDRLAIYDLTTGETAEVPGIEKKYNSLFEPKLNEDYIIYLDCKSEYGGAICGMDRKSNETFVIREFLYGKPIVSLSGQYVCWMQQTGRGVDSGGNATYGTDRLYVYDLSTQECVEIETFANTYFSYSAAYIGDDAIIYVQPDGEDQLVTQENSSASTDAEIVVIPLTEGGDQQAIRFIPGTFVYNPLIEGDYIVYLDNAGGPGTHLMMCKKSGNGYSDPVEIATDVLNYDVGDGYVVYTLEQAIYIYYFSDGSTCSISSKSPNAILASANGSEVVWYDVTDGLDSSTNVIMHITVP